MRFSRRSARAWPIPALAVALGLTGCSGSGEIQQPSCTVTGVSVQPGLLTLNVGESMGLGATVAASDCRTPPAVTWSSGNPEAVTVQGSGSQVTVTAVAPIAAPVTITATAGTRSGSTLVTVRPLPAISLAPATVAFLTDQGGADPAGQIVTVTNGGGGTLSGLTVGAISYGSGASGWLLAPTLSGSTAEPSVTMVLQPVTEGLAAGVYTATVTVQSDVAANGPQQVAVTLTVLPPPAIAISPASIAFVATAGGANPASQAITITNSGAGTLSGLSLGPISYGPGADGWLQASGLSATSASPSAAFTLEPVTGSLGIGVYTATVPVLSPVAANSPRVLQVTFTVLQGGTDPCLPANAEPIAVGQVLPGVLAAATSCLLPTGHLADHYLLTLPASANLRIDLSAGHDSYLELLEFPSGLLIEEDDDDGPGNDARIVRTLPGGQYLLRARTFSPGVTGTYSLSVQSVVIGPAASVALHAGNAQVTTAGTTVPVPPAVIVQDANGFPVAGVTVNFAVLPAVGAITGAVATTDAQGIATLGSWTLASGPNVLSATAGGGALIGSPVIFSATGSASAAGFNVHLRFLTMPTLGQFQAFATSVTRWQTILTSDLIDVPVGLQAGFCTAGAPAMDEVVDDLVIFVRLVPIDGPGGTLGSAGPCFLRAEGSLPILGVMRFDVADLAGMESDGSLPSVILHEMGHVLGIGTLWRLPPFNLLANPSLPSSPGVDTHYTGLNGIAGFNLIGGATYTGGAKVPVENALGGSGTQDGHWREGVLANELMTGFIDDGPNPLSVLTVRSLEDLGYAVNVDAADPFFLSLSLRAPEAPTPRRKLVGDLYRGPLYRIDASGLVTDLLGRPVNLAPGKR